jgi:hypothetical protein
MDCFESSQWRDRKKSYQIQNNILLHISKNPSPYGRIFMGPFLFIEFTFLSFSTKHSVIASAAWQSIISTNVHLIVVFYEFDKLIYD